MGNHLPSQPTKTHLKLKKRNDTKHRQNAVIVVCVRVALFIVSNIVINWIRRNGK